MAHRDTSHSVLVVADGVEQTVDVQMGSGQHTLTALQVLRRYKRRHGGRRQAVLGRSPRAQCSPLCTPVLCRQRWLRSCRETLGVALNAMTWRHSCPSTPCTWQVGGADCPST
jgi:hypothetical protein